MSSGKPSTTLPLDRLVTTKKITAQILIYQFDRQDIDIELFDTSFKKNNFFNELTHYSKLLELIDS